MGTSAEYRTVESGCALGVSAARKAPLWSTRLNAGSVAPLAERIPFGSRTTTVTGIPLWRVKFAVWLAPLCDADLQRAAETAWIEVVDRLRTKRQCPDDLIGYLGSQCHRILGVDANRIHPGWNPSDLIVAVLVGDSLHEGRAADAGAVR